ncbi:MAG: hypothetical protein IIB54_14020 [Planctomycetes bacterium]|nr:hypothetical protein [Planctomycetota bacterium]
MPTNHKSPYASSFKSAMKLGTPCGVAVNNIAKNSKKSPTMVFESLFKAGLCFRQKFNGQFVYWTSEKCKKGTATVRNECQHNMWQCFIDWFISSGFCTPEQLKNHCGSQQEFMAFCRKFFAKQISATTGKKKRKVRKTGRKSTTRKRTTTKAKKRKTTIRSKRRKTTRKPVGRKTTSRGSYKFPTAKRRSSTHRYRRAA